MKCCSWNLSIHLRDCYIINRTESLPQCTVYCAGSLWSPGRSPNQLTAWPGDDSPTVPPTWFAPALNCSLIIICNWEQNLTFNTRSPGLESDPMSSTKILILMFFFPQLLKLFITIPSVNVGIESKAGGEIEKISWFVITNNEKMLSQRGKLKPVEHHQHQLHGKQQLYQL